MATKSNTDTPESGPIEAALSLDEAKAAALAVLGTVRSAIEAGLAALPEVAGNAPTGNVRSLLTQFVALVQHTHEGIV